MPLPPLLDPYHQHFQADLFSSLLLLVSAFGSLSLSPPLVRIFQAFHLFTVSTESSFACLTALNSHLPLSEFHVVWSASQ